MATLDELIVRIEANTSQLRREMKRADNTVRRSTNRMDQSLKKMDKAFLRVGRAAKGFVLAFAGIAAIKSVINTTTSFAKSIADLSAITGAAGKDLEFFKEQAREIGRTTTKGAAEAAEAFKLIASAKPELLENAKALAAITKEAVTLSEASGLTLPNAARALTVALNQFGASADQAGRFINVMAAGAKLGAAEIPDLTSALAKAGTQAAASGISFEEFNAVVQRIAQFKEPIERSATALRNVLIILETGAKETRPSVVGLTTALENLAKQNLDTAQLAARFGRENINLARQLISVRESANKLTGAITGTSVAYEQAKTRTKGLAGATERLKNAWDELNLSIGGSGSAIDSLNSILAQSLQGLALIAKSMRRAFGSEAAFTIDELTARFKELNFELAALPADARKVGGFTTNIADRKKARDIRGERREIIESLRARGVDPVSALGPPQPIPPFPTGFQFGGSAKAAPPTPLTTDPRRLAIAAIGPTAKPFDAAKDFLAERQKSADRESEIEKQKAKSIEQTQKRLEIAVLRSEGKIEAAIKASAQQELEAFKASVEGRKDAAQQVADFTTNLNKRVSADIKSALQQQTAAARELGVALETAFQDALFRANDFGDILEALGRKLVSIALFGSGGSSGLLGGLFSKLGGSLSKAFSFGKAGGGRIQPGIPTVVGERGREIIIPSVPSTVLNAADSRRAMGGPPVNIIQNITFTTDVRNNVRAEVLTLAPAVAAQAASAVFDELRRR